MRRNAEIVHEWLGLSEGGYVNHPDDPGGPTNKGVTQRVYSAWLRGQGRENLSVLYITKGEAERIFEEQYFAPVWFDKLPDGLDYAMADFSVNSGPSRAVKELQQVLVKHGYPMAIDGHMGAITFGAVMDMHHKKQTALLVGELCFERLAFMQSLRNWKTFKKGWTRRVMGDEAGQQDGDCGVIDRGIKMARGNYPHGLPAPKGPVPGRAVEVELKMNWLVKLIVGFLTGGARVAN